MRMMHRDAALESIAPRVAERASKHLPWLSSPCRAVFGSFSARKRSTATLPFIAAKCAGESPWLLRSLRSDGRASAIHVTTWTWPCIAP